MHEFFVNYFSFDTKFAKSAIPFLIKPGYLTNRFNEGQRVSFVHPLRLYLIVSIIFFFLATWAVRNSLDEVSLESARLPDNVEVADSAQAFSGWRKVMNILEDETLSDPAALDSLKQLGAFEADSSALPTRVFHQIRRVAQNDLDVFAGFVLQNMPVMMFLLIPLFALLLKLLYVRRKQWLYVQHLVHALHLHAFILFLLILGVVPYLAFNISEQVANLINMLVILVLSIYSLVSFRRVYQQGWFKTTFKLFLAGVVYFLVLLVFGLSEAVISFMLF